MGETKVCTGPCGRELPLSSFYRSKRGKMGRRANCKDCQNDRTYRWREENREQYLALRQAEHRRSEARRFAYSLKQYGLTVDDYYSMLEAQGDVCAICGGDQTDRFTRLSVDHCHTTDRVRGLLCDPCNRILGMIKDSPEHAISLALYLEAP